MPKLKISSFLLFLLLCLAATPAAAAEPAVLVGTWLDATPEADVVSRGAAVDQAADTLPFLIRGIARRRLKAATTVSPRLEISLSDGKLSIGGPDRDTYTTTIDGTPIHFQNERGQDTTLARTWLDDRLDVRAGREGSHRENTIRVSADGQTMTMEVAIFNDRLEEPIRYLVTYTRQP